MVSQGRSKSELEGLLIALVQHELSRVGHVKVDCRGARKHHPSVFQAIRPIVRSLRAVTPGQLFDGRIIVMPLDRAMPTIVAFNRVAIILASNADIALKRRNLFSKNLAYLDQLVEPHHS